MRRAIILSGIAIPTITALLFALLGRGSHDSHNALGKVAVPLFLLLLCAAAVLAFFRRRAAFLACLGALTVVVSVFAAFGSGRIAVALDSHTLEVLSNRSVPALDQYRASTGGYPQALSTVGLPAHPSSGACVLLYSGTGTSFSFVIPDPLMGSRSREWTSQDRRWRTVWRPHIWQ